MSAHHVALTRGSWLARLAGLPDQLGLAPAASVGVLVVGLDYLRPVADAVGYEAALEVVRIAADRVREWAAADNRVVDTDEQSIVVVIPGLLDPRQAEELGEQLRCRLADPVRVADRLIRRTASVGFALGSAAELADLSLPRRAENALADIRRDGGDAVRGRDRVQQVAATADADLELELPFAIEDGQIRVHFQPIIDLKTGAVVSVEALTRWAHPRLGLLGASRFIPMAERTGLVRLLDSWVLRAACEQHANWRLAFPFPARTLHVNVSPDQLGDPRTTDLVSGVLRQTGVPAAELVIEVTELSARRSGPSAAVLESVRALGSAVVLDDFGAGLSSLQRLHTLPVDGVKIDQQFVRTIATSAPDSAILAGMIRLARDLGIALIAEGVESAAAYERVRALGCRYAQGDWLMPAAPPTRVTRLLSTGGLDLDRRQDMRRPMPGRSA